MVIRQIIRENAQKKRNPKAWMGIQIVVLQPIVKQQFLKAEKPCFRWLKTFYSTEKVWWVVSTVQKKLLAKWMNWTYHQNPRKSTANLRSPYSDGLISKGEQFDKEWPVLPNPHRLLDGAYIYIHITTLTPKLPARPPTSERSLLTFCALPDEALQLDAPCQTGRKWVGAAHHHLVGGLFVPSEKSCCQFWFNYHPGLWKISYMLTITPVIIPSSNPSDTSNPSIQSIIHFFCGKALPNEQSRKNILDNNGNTPRRLIIFWNSVSAVVASVARNRRQLATISLTFRWFDQFARSKWLSTSKDTNGTNGAKAVLVEGHEASRHY